MSLDRIKRDFPNEHWKAVKNGFNWDYESSEGGKAHWVSQMVSVHPDDMDGHARSELMLTESGGRIHYLYHSAIYST